MNSGTKLILFIGLLTLVANGCANNQEFDLIKKIGRNKYDQIMNMTLDEFDQSSIGFRNYDYRINTKLIPAYISHNSLSHAEARNLHWHLGQLHAFNGNYKEAIAEMKQSYGSSISWKCYVDGTIAFLEKDQKACMEAYNLLAKQENTMNIEFLVKFLDNFDRSYSYAYNAKL